MNDDSTRGGETGGCRPQRQVAAALHHSSFVAPETHHAHRPTAMAGGGHWSVTSWTAIHPWVAVTLGAVGVLLDLVLGSGTVLTMKAVVLDSEVLLLDCPRLEWHHF